MVLPALLALAALVAVMVVVHLEQRTMTPAPRPDWVVHLEQTESVADLLRVPLPKVTRGFDPVAVRAVIARAAELSDVQAQRAPFDSAADSDNGDPDGTPDGDSVDGTGARTDGAGIDGARMDGARVDVGDVRGSIPSEGAG